jgi:hypothetical protein
MISAIFESNPEKPWPLNSRVGHKNNPFGKLAGENRMK